MSTVLIVVITEDNALNNNAETKDSLTLYSQNPARSGKLIHTEASDSRALLERLSEIQHDSQKLTVVFMGHHTQGGGLAHFSHQDIARYLFQYKQISKVVLFGCNTVKAPLLTEEIEIERLRQVTMKVESEEEIERGCLFATLENYPSTPLVEHNFAQTDSQALIYILVKVNKQYSLLYVDREKKTENLLIENLNSFQMKWLEACINNGKQFSFKKNVTFFPNKNKKLDEIAVENIHTLLFLSTATYKEIKKYYPTFNHIKTIEKPPRYSLLDKIISTLEDCYIRKVDNLPLVEEYSTYFQQAM